MLFLDSDDILCPGAIEALMSEAISENADIVEGSFHTMTKSGVLKRHHPHKTALGSFGAGMYGYAWGKVYRRELFSKVCFPEGFWFEDTIVPSLLFPLATITKTIAHDIVLYRTNPKGITMSSYTNPRCIHTLYIIDTILEAQLALNLPIAKRSTIWQLGPYLYGRIYALPKNDIHTAFLLACDLVDRYSLANGLDGLSFYENELREAFIYKQFSRWKWASTLI